MCFFFFTLTIVFIIFFFFYLYGSYRDLHSFPTRRSSDLPLRGERQRRAVARGAYLALARGEAPIRERHRVRAEHETLGEQGPVSRDELYGPPRVPARK